MSEAQHDLFGRRVAATAQRRQLQLPLGWRGPAQSEPAARRFLTSDSNSLAAQHILGQANWTAPATLLSGPKLSGRSTLGRMFLEAGGGILIDDVERADEEAVFHAWNRAMAGGTTLLCIAGSPSWPATVQLPDLRTRVATMPHVEIGTPDACLTRDIVEWSLAERGIAAAPRLGSYVAARIERSYAALHAAVSAIETSAVASGQGASISVARAALIEAGLYDGSNPTVDDSPEPV